jgi:hypothetical protein
MKKISSIIVLCSSLLYGGLALSESIIYSTVSYHSNGNIPNNRNFGKGYEKQFKNNVHFGFLNYQNSYDRNSNLFFIAKRKDLNKNWTVGVNLAIADNYKDHKASLKNGMLVMPMATVQYKNIRVTSSDPFTALIGKNNVYNLSLVFSL